jgi:N-methylhydantoinase A
VTDANLALGKIDPAYFAGGKIALDEAGARRALQKNVGDKLSLKDFWPAAGVTEIVEENMANAARVHAIELGRDIAACTMIAFGGGAPLHACRLAEKVGVTTVIVPMGAGVGSAIGFLRAPVAYEITKSAVTSIESFDAQRVNRLLDGMKRDARAVVEPALAGAKASVQIIADCRYVGQGHEIRVNVPVRKLKDADGKRLKAAFEKTYEQVYGLRIPNQEVEAITWSVTVSSKTEKPKRAARAARRAAPQPRSRRTIYDPALGKQVHAPVYWRFDMKPGSSIKGPAIIAEDETSTIVGARFSATINSLGYIVMERKP